MTACTRVSTPGVERNCTRSREWLECEWPPIHNMNTEEVFGTIRDTWKNPHHAYALGNDRLSCVFCIMASRSDLRNSARNHFALYRQHIEIEEPAGYAAHMFRTPLRELPDEAA